MPSSNNNPLVVPIMVVSHTTVQYPSAPPTPALACWVAHPHGCTINNNMLISLSSIMLALLYIYHRCFMFRYTGAPHQFSDDLKLCVRHQSGATRLGSGFETVRECGATAGPRRAHKCALHFAAAWGHRGILVGELAARTSLRGDVEVAHPATYPCFSTPPRCPRAP